MRWRARAGRSEARADDLRRAAEYWDTHNLSAPDDVLYWLAVPRVRAAVNARLTGDPDVLYITRFLAALDKSPPPRQALSVGCGAGELDRGVALEGGVRRVDGIDVSAASLAVARELAARAGLARRVRNHRVDAASWLGGRRRRRYDLIFCHGSLHHVEDLETVLGGAAAALGGGRPGLLYVDEYVGPSRDEWQDEHLRPAAELFARVPPPFRRTPEVWPPLAIDDPTEMIRSSQIPAAIRRSFELDDYRPYYGNVLAPLVCALRASALGEPEVAAVLDEAIAREEALAAEKQIAPLYALFVGRPKRSFTGRGESSGV